MRIAIKSNNTIKIYNGDINYNNLCDFIKKEFQLSPSKYTLTYIDEDGDNITLASNDDMASAYELNNDKHLLKVTLNLIESTGNNQQMEIESISEPVIMEEEVKPTSKQTEEPQKGAENDKKSPERPCWGRRGSPSGHQEHPWFGRQFGHGHHQPFGPFGFGPGHEGPHGPFGFGPGHHGPHGPHGPFGHHGPRGPFGPFGHPGHHGPERFGMFQEMMNATIADRVDERIKNLIPCIKTQLEGGHFTKTFSVQNPLIHQNTECKSCLASPITGIRYKCLECHNFSLCENCEPLVQHEHNLLKMKNISQEEHSSEMPFPCKFFKKFWKHGGHRHRSHSSSSEKCGKEDRITRKLANIFGGQPKRYEEFVKANKSLNKFEAINKYAMENGEQEKLINFRCEKVARRLDRSPEEFKEVVKSNMNLRPWELIHKLRESGIEFPTGCGKSAEKHHRKWEKEERKCERRWEKEEKKCRKKQECGNADSGNSERTEKSIILETLIGLFGPQNVKEYFKLIEQHFSKGEEAIINLWLQTHIKSSA